MRPAVILDLEYTITRMRMDRGESWDRVVRLSPDEFQQLRAAASEYLRREPGVIGSKVDSARGSVSLVVSSESDLDKSWRTSAAPVDPELLKWAQGN